MENNWKKDYFRYKDFFLNILSLYRDKPNILIYLELILSITTIIVFSIFAIKPTVLTIIELNTEIKEKELLSARLKQKITDLNQANNYIQNRQEDINYINQSVPGNAEAEKLIQQIEELSNNNSLKIANFSSSDIILFGKESSTSKVTDLKKIDGINELHFVFSTNGTYGDTINFLDQLENLRRPIKFDSFLMNSSIIEDNKLINLTVTGRVPFLISI